MPKQTNRISGPDVRRPLIAYYATLAVLAVVAFLPDGRVWGFNWWGYYPFWVPVALLVIGGAIPLFFVRPHNHEVTEEDASSSRLFWFIGSLIGIVYIASFCTLYNRTHFLGDGATLISLMSKVQPLSKPREIGESLIHIWVRDLFGGPTEWATLMSFRTISIGAGVVTLLVTLLASAKLLDRTRSRLLFLLGMLSGGYLLLYFGYVENYSLLSLSIVAYSLLGIFIAQDRIKRWWILLPQAAAAFFHIFGVIVIPATVYLLFRSTKVSGWIRSQSAIAKSVIGLLAVAVIAAGFAWAAGRSLFFQLALLSLTPNRFTIEGYTLFSPTHLIDYLNLLFLLTPGLVVFVTCLEWRRFRSDLSLSPLRFLLIAVLCCYGAAFIFDPKLGMARDWDLLSLGSIPMTAFVFYYVITCRRQFTLVAVLMISLGLLVLYPRAVSQAVPEVSLAHARNYMEIDEIQNRTFYMVIKSYYVGQGDTAAAADIEREWNIRFPQYVQTIQMKNLLLAKRYREALYLGRQIVQKDPLIHAAWSNLGLAFESFGAIDSAIYCHEIANALNPGNAVMEGNLASAYIRKGDLDKAERVLKAALAADSTISAFYYHKARIANKRGDRREYLRQLIHAASRPDAPIAYLFELSEIYLRAGDVTRVTMILDTALARGLDTVAIDAFVKGHPQLGSRDGKSSEVRE